MGIKTSSWICHECFQLFVIAEIGNACQCEIGGLQHIVIENDNENSWGISGRLVDCEDIKSQGYKKMRRHLRNYSSYCVSFLSQSHHAVVPASVGRRFANYCEETSRKHYTVNIKVIVVV